MADNYTFKDATGATITHASKDVGSGVQATRHVEVDEANVAIVKAADAAHSSGDKGLMVLAVRKDTAAALAGTDGDYIPLIVDANGRLHVRSDDSPSTSVVTGAISASLTASQLATVAAKLVRLKASPHNTGLIYVGPSSIANAVSDSQLVAYWKLDEASGFAYDSGPYANDLAPYNAPVAATGKIGNGRAFVAASSQYLEIPDNPYLSMGAGERLTIVFWVKLSSTAGQTWIGKIGASGSFEYWVDLDSVKARFAVSSTGADAAVVSATGFGNLSSDTWYMICARYNGTTISISVNALAPTTAAYSSDIFDAAATFRIGARSSGSPYANAVIDEVGIWKRALSDDEVTALYAAGAGLSYPYLPAGFQLAAGDDTGWIPLDNLNRLYQLGTNSNDVLSYMVLA